MRYLSLIPIIHSPEDLGGLRESIQEAYVKRQGQEGWEAYLASVDTLWEKIRLMVDEMGPDWSRVRVYQDGLPVCDHEEAIVRELAKKGSPNHQLLADLIDRGAKLTGTESPALLIKEYEFNRRVLAQRGASPTATASPQSHEQARRLLEERDKFIANRIAQTLGPNEDGLIFLGMLHSLERELPRDIQLKILSPRKGRLAR